MGAGAASFGAGARLAEDGAGAFHDGLITGIAAAGLPHSDGAAGRKVDRGMDEANADTRAAGSDGKSRADAPCWGDGDRDRIHFACVGTREGSLPSDDKERTRERYT